MLEELHISGLGVIEDAWLSLHPGLNVLTGETGAGKTMVTVALGLALGGRASSAMLRAGAPRVAVEAQFRPDRGDSGHDALAEWLDPGDEELILSRTVGADGRSGARINGRMAPASSMESLGRPLVEIHGQSQAERLASPAAQTAFLDRFAGQAHLAVLSRYRDVHGRLGRARAALRAIEADAREREREMDLLSYQVREIEAAGVAPGELAALEGEESRLAHAERILALVASADRELADEGGATDAIRAAAEAARSVASLDPSAHGLAERLAGLAAEAEDAARDIRAYRDGVEVDPARLEAVRERIQVLKGLERKYGDGEEGVLSFLREARARLAELGSEEGSREALAEEITSLGEEQSALAARLSEVRGEAAPRLGGLLAAEVHDLGMPGARLDVTLAPLEEPGSDGAERAEVTFSGGPGQPVLPLAKVASGGELSRTMLACRSVLADLDDVPTLVFDEVDAGIGGRAAAAVGRRLARLARFRQLLVVTHLAQIASHADRHFVVTKEDGAATVRLVDGEERVAEVARMLSGSTAEVSLAHARELLAASSPVRKERVKAATGGRAP